MEKDSCFSLVRLRPEYYKHGYVDWIKLEEVESISLKNFDLVTGFNPYNRLSLSEINTLLGGEKMTRDLITVDIISAAAKKNGYVIYQREIAHRLGRIYGVETPNSLTKDNVNTNLKILIKEGEHGCLKPVCNAVVRDEYSADLAVLFRKTG